MSYTVLRGCWFSYCLECACINWGQKWWIKSQFLRGISSGFQLFP